MAKTLQITKENAAFQVMLSLKTNREKRNKYGFLFEGVRNINNAIASGWEITTFIYSSGRALSGWAKDILKNSKAEIHYDLSLKLLEKLSDKDDLSELMAIATKRKNTLDDIPVDKELLVVAFDRPSNPGNLGALIRSCDAMGVNGLIITGHGADIYDPQTVRASTGSLFSLPIVQLNSHVELFDWTQKLRQKYSAFQIVGTDEKAEKTIYDFDFARPTLLVAGNEKMGMSAGYKEIIDETVMIPIEGAASSLNVAVATSIVISEIRRQRLFS